MWSQFTGRPVVGPLTGSGIELAVLPVTIASWRDWRDRHPDTKVLSLDTGYERDYASGQPYGDYFASAELMFPMLVPDERLMPKDYVFALRADGREQAWSLADVRRRPGDQCDRRRSAGRAGRRRCARARCARISPAGRSSRAGSSPTTLVADGHDWQIREDALVGPDGARLPRLPGHIAYWFAWQGFIDGAPLAEPGAVRDVQLACR